VGREIDRAHLGTELELPAGCARGGALVKPSRQRASDGLKLRVAQSGWGFAAAWWNAA
jgi:hypothetical protein